MVNVACQIAEGDPDPNLERWHGGVTSTDDRNEYVGHTAR